MEALCLTESKDIQSWLCGKHTPNTERFEECERRRLSGTCSWIFEKEIYRQWEYSELELSAQVGKLFWLHGHAGFGKSVLCASIVNDLLKSGKAVAHCFLSSGIEDPYVIIRSWVSQMIFLHQHAFEIACQAWREDQHGQLATRNTITTLLREILKASDSYFLITDGLDECSVAVDGDSSDMADFLETVTEITTDTKAHILVASRDIAEVRQVLKPALPEQFYECKISEGDIRSDITLYSQSIVDRKLANKDDQVKAHISEQMAKRCSGQFLWLRLQENSLRKGLNKAQLQRSIEDTPMGLDSLYERYWSRILSSREGERARAMQLLRWVAFAFRKLTVEEVTEAVLVYDSVEEFPSEELPDAIDEDFVNSEILELCSPFIEVDEPSLTSIPIKHHIVQLAHFTVKEYLLKVLPNGNREPFSRANEKLQHKFLGKLCLKYLGFDGIWEDGKASDPSVPNQFTKSFRNYVAGFWGVHVTLGTPADLEVVKEVLDFANCQNPNWKAWRLWSDKFEEDSLRDRRWSKWRQPCENTLKYKGWTLGESTQSPDVLYYMVRLGLTDVAFTLLRSYSVAKDVAMSFRTVLNAAAFMGNVRVMKSLLDMDAIPNLLGIRKTISLHIAAAQGHSDVVRLLLYQGADANGIRDKRIVLPPLHWACSNGTLELVKDLINHGADLDLKTVMGNTALHTASRGGHSAVAQILIETGLDVDAVDVRGWTPLAIAVDHGQLDIVELLIRRKATIDIASDNGASPLLIALDHRHLAIADLLLKEGADVNWFNSKRRTALIFAADWRSIETTKWLLQKGADVNFADHDGWTPLLLAARYGHSELAKLLLENGANPNSSLNDNGWTPLLFACRHGYPEVVDLLLEKGVDPNVALHEGQKPLLLALLSKHNRIADLLLGKNANTDMSSSLHLKLLRVAMGKDKLDDVELLLSMMPRAYEDMGPEWGSLLYFAAQIGDLDILKVLCHANYTHLHTPSNLGHSALFLASIEGHQDVVEFLVGVQEVDVNTRDWKGRTALCAATTHGHLKVVKILVNAGANLECVDHEGQSLIWWAKRGGCKEVYAFLKTRIEKAGFQLEEDDAGSFQVPIRTTQHSDAFCDGCIRWLDIGEIYQTCVICTYDGLALCSSCILRGLSCPTSSHELSIVDPGVVYRGEEPN